MNPAHPLRQLLPQHFPRSRRPFAQPDGPRKCSHSPLPRQRPRTSKNRVHPWQPQHRRPFHVMPASRLCLQKQATALHGSRAVGHADLNATKDISHRSSSHSAQKENLILPLALPKRAMQMQHRGTVNGATALPILRVRRNADRYAIRGLWRPVLRLAPLESSLRPLAHEASVAASCPHLVSALVALRVRTVVVTARPPNQA
jgi:hypothetical protein